MAMQSLQIIYDQSTRKELIGCVNWIALKSLIWQNLELFRGQSLEQNDEEIIKGSG